MTRLAAIDCGTNSIRLLIADATTANGQVTLTDLGRHMRIVRLGQGVDRTGMLAPEAVERALGAIDEYRAMIDEAGAESIRFVATSAMRDARNKELFTGPVRDILGVDVEVVPGTEEASLSFSGAARGVPAGRARPLMVVDIGGGSTELVLGETSVGQAISIDMGSVRITEKFFANCDPNRGIPAEAEAEATAWIDQQLDAAEEVVDLRKVRTLVGVAGTVTTLTAQVLGLEKYEPQRINGAVQTLADIDQAVRYMVDQPIDVKAALGFMPTGRADVIAGGALVWSRIVHRVAQRSAEAGHPIDTVVTSEHDILDGIALSMMV